MVSLLQDQSNIKFSPSDPLERDQQDLMKAQGDSISPVQQSDNPSYSCQPYEPDTRTERRSSESSHSPSPASPSQDPIHSRYPASQGIPCGQNKLKASFSTEKFRRCSYEESAAGSYDRFLKSSRNPFHPYKRQLSQDVFQEAHQALPPEASPFKSHGSIDGFEALPGPAEEPEAFSTHIPNISGEQPWCDSLQYSSTGQEHGSQVMQDSDMKLRTSPLEGQPGLYCYQPQQMYCPSHSFHQYPSGGSYPVTYITSSHYPYQRIAPQSSQESQQPLFPKPIYSYSILIFMALKNSKTGSLPVSEIYNFMTEHFPYFKTAPDGWKNSVRHNLSLNKCFEKVENKSGNSSRKGCLWALNPAKIDKMQEELQKWKRKDPVAVRKSMAKPEELDTLIGDRSEKLRSPLLPRSPRQMAAQPHGLCEPPRGFHGIPAPAALPAESPLPALLGGQQPGCFTPPQGFPQMPTALLQHPQDPPSLFAAGEAQSQLRTQPSIPQDSPVPAQSPPSCGMKALPEHSPARTVQDSLLQEGDLSNDIDALNPSLTDFDLQGNLWEELKDDSLAVDPLVLISSSPMPSQCFPSHCQLESSSSVPAGAGGAHGGAHGSAHGSAPELQLTTLYSAFMELDTLSPSYLSSPGSKPIALM
ncbi:forkhead box protein N1 [Oenanthe melanoleuca]|uniref:forkhead box protein N1 n=1 Tax=Oenanthe melanoleuca TaxID=2939378 RepID=UPI0024C1BEF9|nr:forkhead box protein N1 [Oenanthe melanoleuca]